MTDAEYDKLKAEIKEKVRFYKDLMGLGLWIITCDYSREICEDCPQRGAYTTAFWAYRDAKITFYLPLLAESTKSLDSAIIHELSHLLVAPMDGSSSDSEMEFAVDSVALAIERAAGINRVEERKDNE